MEVSSACGLQCLTLSPHSSQFPQGSQFESQRGAFLCGVCIYFLEYSGFLPSPNTCIWVIGELAVWNSSQTWDVKWYCLSLYIHPMMSWWLVQVCTPPLAQRQLVIGFSPHPHMNKRNVLSPQRMERCWSLLHGGKVKVETAKWTANKSIFYSICHVPFCRQVKEHKIKSGQWNEFIHSCTLRVSHYRVRSANPDWNQIIPAAPRCKPTHHWKRRDCEQQRD